MMPAFTKPMTMTVMAPELCMAAVPTAPIPTPYSLLLDAFANIFFSLLLLNASIFELSILQAVRNTPIPASNASTAVVSAKSSKNSSPAILSHCHGMVSLEG